MIKKIISGGQTGPDRAALDLARKLGIEHGGWCPQGRLAEDGALPARYHLQATASSDTNVRTRKNIEDSDGSLILVPSTSYTCIDGTRLTLDHARQLTKPHLVLAVDLAKKRASHQFNDWIGKHQITILNIAGPRESNWPGLYSKSLALLLALFHLHDAV